jgi:hypothetical protein
MEQYVLPALALADTVTITFDLWQSRAGHDTFTMVVNFVDKEWEPKHVTIGLFECQKTSGAALAEIVKPLLKNFHLHDKVIAYVKDEGSNLVSLATSLTSVASCPVLGLETPYSRTCFGHVMSKVCQHATTDEKVCTSMKKVSVKVAQAKLQSTITWTKKSGLGRQEWAKACIEAGLPVKKLRTPMKTRFASRVILFQVRISCSFHWTI